MNKFHLSRVLFNLIASVDTQLHTDSKQTAMENNFASFINRRINDNTGCYPLLAGEE